MIFLGIDPSLNSTGYGVIKKEGTRLFYITSGIIKFKVGGNAEDFHSKLLQISNKLTEIIQEFKPQKASIEETFVNSNSQSSLKLGIVRGAIILTLMQQKLEISEFSPNFIKKVITGNGKAEKSQVAFMVPKLLSTFSKEQNFISEDESDALGIAIALAI
jgi:crossover junction endodeoxyribonuclease RuvC